ncbi:hypothetical protein RhiLY_13060 [Ceratobasidium sp. AG-Ba]|nr:hypothetical protein RhiLY_13060 [Ceratobasidium sp. AG-Ba]
MSKPRTHAISDKEYEEYQEFLAFKAMKAARDAATSSRAALASESNERRRSPTIGRTSDPATPNHWASRGQSVHSKAPTYSGGDYQTAEEFRHDNSTSPSRRQADYRIKIPSSTQKRAPSLPKSTPPPLSEQDKMTPPPTKNTPVPPVLSTPPPRDGPWPYSRDASQEPRLDAPLAQDNAQDDVPDDAGTGDPIANVNEHIVSIDDPNPYSYPYKQTPTSHIDTRFEDGMCGHGGQSKTKTAIEKLGDRLSKFQYTLEHAHPFAAESKIPYFNPYSVVRAPLNCYGIVPKPKELTGGGGRGPLPLHDAAGLRMDQDFWNTLKCYDLAPVFQHFRNSTGQDSWLIALILQQYLQGSPNLGKVKQLNKKLKAELFPDKTLYEDDYSTNAPTEPSTRTKKDKSATSRAPAATSHRAATANPNPRAVDPNPRAVDPSRGKTADRSRGQATNPLPGLSDQPRPHATRDATSTPNTSHVPRTSTIPDDSDDNHEPGPSSSSTHDLPPAPTARQVRKADKQVAQEEARREVADSRSNKSRPSASDRAKGKQRAEPLEPTQVHNESDEDDKEAIRTFTTKVKVGARQHAAAKLPEPTREPSTSTSGKKSRPATAPANVANKAPNKPSAKAPTNAKPPKTSLAQPSEPSSKIQTERPTSTKRKLAKDKDENGEEEDEDEESTPSKRGKTGQAGSSLKRKTEQEEEDEEARRASRSEKTSSPQNLYKRLAPEPEPETPLDSVIDISSSTPSRAQIDVAQTSSSDAAEPGASVEAPILVGSSDPSNEGVVDPTAGQRVVKTTKMRISRPAKTIAPSDRTLRNRS